MKKKLKTTEFSSTQKRNRKRKRVSLTISSMYQQVKRGSAFLHSNYEMQ